MVNVISYIRGWREGVAPSPEKHSRTFVPNFQAASLQKKKKMHKKLGKKPLQLEKKHQNWDQNFLSFEQNFYHLSFVPFFVRFVPNS